MQGGHSGAVVVSGKPEKSLLYEKVEKGEMPPAAKDRLSDTERELLRRWIAEGIASESTDAMKAPVNQHDVVPIMLRHCTVCHGRHRQEAGLDLRTKAGMLRGGKSGPALILGKPAESLLLQKVRAGKCRRPSDWWRSASSRSMRPRWKC